MSDDFVPTNANCVLISANPLAGEGVGKTLIAPLAELLRQQGFRVELLTDLAAVAESANQLHTSGNLRCVVAAGGDGTVAELVNRTAPGAPIAIFPMGTANLLARHLGIIRNIQTVSRMVAAGRIVRLDAGCANGRLFLLMAGCGFDAEVVERLHRDRQGHISYWSYFKPILASIRSYAYPQLRVYCDPVAPAGLNAGDGAKEIVGRWAFVVNLPGYAGGLQFAPQADGGDGLLDICTFERGSLWSGLKYLCYVRFGRQRRLPDCTMTTARRVRIESTAPTMYQLDGDPGGLLPLEIEVLPQRLTLMVPHEANEPR